MLHFLILWKVLVSDSKLIRYLFVRGIIFLGRGKYTSRFRLEEKLVGDDLQIRRSIGIENYCRWCFYINRRDVVFTLIDGQSFSS